MGIIQRFKDIMSANINALLDKAENPEKMIDQYLRNLESDLAKVKQETASVMAEETKAKRQLDECTSEIAKMQSYAERAVLAGNDEDAKKFLMKKLTNFIGMIVIILITLLDLVNGIIVKDLMMDIIIMNVFYFM